MDTKCCSSCAHTLPITSFLKDASAAPNSRVFAVCFPCRERVTRSRNKRKASRQLGPETPIIPLETSIPANILNIEASFPAWVPIQAPLQPLATPTIPPLPP